MSIQSDAAKEYLAFLFQHEYGALGEINQWQAEYKFDEKRKWRFDYAVPALKVAIELDGATFKPGTGHNTGVGLRAWREKNNAAMSLGWRVWHYAPEEVIKAGRKMLKVAYRSHFKNINIDTGISTCVTLLDEPVLTILPWLKPIPFTQVRL